MPTVLRYKGYRFFFVSYDCKEMMHVHVVKERKSCKFWLKSRANIYLADNNGFKGQQLNMIRNKLIEHYSHIKQKWDEHCKELY